MGGDDGYYATLLHELLHATGHPRRLDRRTTGDYSPKGYATEEGTVVAALRTVLREIGFPLEALNWHASVPAWASIDEIAARAAARWILSD
jgi:putative DNA primase/helicase